MVTTLKTTPPAAPAKAAAAVPAKPAAPVKAVPTAKKAAPKPALKKVVKKAAPRAKTPVKKAVKAAVKAVPAKKAVAKPTAVKTVATAVAKPKATKPVKEKKPKLVRDSFTIPKAEYTVLADLKQRAGKLGSSVKKSELLRAGIKALAAMADSALVAALKAVPAVKTGRPAKD